MPSVKSKRSKTKVQKQMSEALVDIQQESNLKRRPSQAVAIEDQIEVVTLQADSELVKSGLQNDTHPEADIESSNPSQVDNLNDDPTLEQQSFDFGKAESEMDRIQLRFPGDTIVKRGFPKTFHLTEEIVNGWASGGNFETLPISNPFIRYAAKSSLKKAKQVETKVLESPVTEKVITKVFEAGFKAQMTIEEVRSRLNLRK